VKPGRRRILITAGPTREPLDPVRFISNASTGAQGAALAAEALSRGWAVDVVHGPLAVGLPRGAIAHPVSTAREMLAACRQLHPSALAVIGAAAVSDFRPRATSARKRKRGAGPWLVELVPTEDILAALARRKRGRVHAGFALEVEDGEANALRKLREKNLDWLVLNGPEAIGAARSRFILLGKDGARVELGILSKRGLASALLDAIESTLGGRQRRKGR
jgi:phosphopantothenoylcysteine decarboxylase/phosphopantothenate--cysteine ligase